MTPRPPYVWSLAGGRALELGLATRVMGILNVTPDSFSDGGHYLEPRHAILAVRRILDEGADLIDVGGESTRPGAAEVPAKEEIRRILPVIEGAVRLGAVVSIDTRKAEVAAAAVEAGAAIVNDVSGLRHDPALAEVVRSSGAGLVLMHSRGTPRDMQADPRYDCVVSEVAAELDEACSRALAAGISPEALVVDPGIGFAKTAEHNLEILRHLDRLVARGRPVLVGASRKSFIGKVLGGKAPGERLMGSVAVAVAAAMKGAHIVRVHDVGATVEALRVTDAICGSLKGSDEAGS
jgi:dihydropteroate synthase